MEVRMTVLGRSIGVEVTLVLEAVMPRSELDNLDVVSVF